MIERPDEELGELDVDFGKRVRKGGNDLEHASRPPAPEEGRHDHRAHAEAAGRGSVDAGIGLAGVRTQRLALLEAQPGKTGVPRHRKADRAGEDSARRGIGKAVAVQGLNRRAVRRANDGKRRPGDNRQRRARFVSRRRNGGLSLHQRRQGR